MGRLGVTDEDNDTEHMFGSQGRSLSKVVHRCISLTLFCQKRGNGEGKSGSGKLGA